MFQLILELLLRLRRLRLIFLNDIALLLSFFEKHPVSTNVSQNYAKIKNIHHDSVRFLKTFD